MYKLDNPAVISTWKNSRSVTSSPKKSLQNDYAKLSLKEF